MLSRLRSAKQGALGDAAAVLVDPEWYAQHNPDVRQAGLDPVTHFCRQGLYEGRLPSPLFDREWYLTHNPDVAGEDIIPCVHFLQTGGLEGRSPHPLFDSQWYLGQYPDVKTSALNPLLHYLQSGAEEGRQPHPLFDPDFYCTQNPDCHPPTNNPLLHFLKTPGAKAPCELFDDAWYLTHNRDVAQSGKPAFLHFLQIGSLEGRSPHPLFDSQYYLDRYPDIQETGQNPLLHYLQSGAQEGRQPHPLFDPDFYCTQNPDCHPSTSNPLLHFIDNSRSDTPSPHPLFDSEHYTAQLSAPLNSNIHPFLHYIMAGSAGKYDPHPLFLQNWYRERNPDLEGSYKTPLAHYCSTGFLHYQNPHPLFDGYWYCTQYMGSYNTPSSNPLIHYIQEGHNNLHNPNPYFLSAWYQKTYMDDTLESVDTTLAHYQNAIDKTIRHLQQMEPIEDCPKPNPWFDSAWYLLENKDVLETNSDPLTHYIEAGAVEGRSPGPNFDPAWYLAQYNTNQQEPLLHFLFSGAAEGNFPNAISRGVYEKSLAEPELVLEVDHNGATKIDPRQYNIIKTSSLFDPQWYQEKYLSTDNNPMDPIEHYLIYGANLGYNPGPDFNSKAYRSNNHDLRNAAINPLLHYIQHGRFEGRHATKEKRDNEVEKFRFSPPEYGPVTDILAFDSDVSAPDNLDETICLHLHLFHADMADEFCDIINRLTVPFTLIVSIQSHEDENIWRDYFAEHIAHADKIIVKCCVNQGRDVQPWLVEFKDIIRDHDIFCHLHTKKSGYNKFQKSWRRYLAHTAFGSRTTVNQILKIFADNKQAGLVFPAYFYILRNQPNYGKNYKQYERLYMTLFGDLPDERCPDYPAGSFFWARTNMLEPLFDLDLSINDFEPEEGQVDGTTAHALERILGTLPAYTDYTAHCIAVDVPFDLTRYIHPARVETLNKELFLSSSFHISRNDKPAIPTHQKKRIAVYSAITGGYENLVKPLMIDPDIDYFLFTDTPEKFSPDWATVIPTPYVSHKPVRTARYAKTHPHFWFPDYDYAIWMDANVVPATSLHSLVQKLEDSPWHAAFIQHPLRYNCMEEGNELIKFGLDDQKLIEQQLIRYGKVADIFAQELIETNFFICRPKLDITKKMMTLWWNELNNFSHRDQLSVNYAILKSGMSWTPLFEDNVSIRDHPDFFLLEHELFNRDEFIRKVSEHIDLGTPFQETA